MKLLALFTASVVLIILGCIVYYLQNNQPDGSTGNKELDDINNEALDMANIFFPYNDKFVLSTLSVQSTQSAPNQTQDIKKEYVQEASQMSQQTGLYVTPSNKKIVSTNIQKVLQEQYKLLSSDDLPWDNDTIISYSLCNAIIQPNSEQNNKQNNKQHTNVTIYEIY